MTDLIKEGVLLGAGLPLFVTATLGVVVVPFFKNEKTSEENLILLHQLFFAFFFGLQSIFIHYIFLDNSDLFDLFLKSIFVPLSESEVVSLRQLKTDTTLLIGSSISTIFLTYFGVHLFEDALKSYSVFLVREADDRIIFFKQELSKFWKKWGLGFVTFVFAFLVISSIKYLLRVF